VDIARADMWVVTPTVEDAAMFIDSVVSVILRD